VGDHLITEAVILAGGLGTRLRGKTGVPKYLLEVDGVPLIRYPIGSLVRAGVEKFTFVVAHLFKKRLENLLRSCELEYCLVENRHPDLGNGYSLLRAEPCVEKSPFYVSMCDHIYTSYIPLQLARRMKEIDDFIVLISGDSSPKYIDIEEATKLITDDRGRLLNAGKRLKTYTHVDTGVFVMSREIFSIGESLESGPLELTSLLISLAMGTGKVFVIDVAGTPWTEVDTVEDLEQLVRGERRIVLRALKKEPPEREALFLDLPSKDSTESFL